VIEVADIFGQHAAVYRANHSLLPSQLRAMRDIELCRTAFFGGHVAQCDHCAEVRYTYHSCRNRHCPKCHGEQSAAWLEKQQSRLLPCPHYLLTFTLPADLRPMARQHVFWVAIANSRLESFADGHVTFRYRDNRTQPLQHVTLRAEEFIGRFMQHILPRGFPKVRYYGLASASRHAEREQARTLLSPVIATYANDAKTGVSPPATKASAPPPLCPHCRIGHLIVVQLLRPQRKFPP
jgi:hypothetical protein